MKSSAIVPLFKPSLFLGALTLVSVSQAADIDFDNDSGDGNWNTPSNWVGNTLPNTGDRVFIGNTVTPPVTISINNALTNDTITELGLGRGLNGTCTINHSAGTLSTTSWLNIGQGFGGGNTTGIYNLSGGSVTKLAGSFGHNILGAFSQGRGELHISGTGSWNILDADGDTRIGGELLGASNTVGIITVTGSGSFNNVGKVYVGYAGQGSVEVSGSGSFTAGELFLGNYGTSNGLLKIIGSSATVSSAQDFDVLAGGHTLEWVADASGVSPISVTGTVTLNNVSLIADLAAFSDNTPVILIQNDGTGAVVGTFNGLPEGAAVGSRLITYSGGDGNDVALVEFTPVVNASAPSFNFQNPVVVSEHPFPIQVDIANFITSYQGNPILRYNRYGNQSTNLGIFTGTPNIANNGTLSFTPRPGVNGTATFAFDAQDNSGGEGAYTAIQYVTITVTPLNYPPTFSGIGDQSSLDSDGAQSIANFITGFSTNDVEQSLVGYSVTNDNTALFATQPTISNNGTLTYTPAAGNYGTANVTVTATDNGADNNVSSTYQFVITVDVDSPVHYVSSTGSNTFPFHTPATAAHTIQDAVDAAEAGDIVQVANGSYNTGGRAAPGENLANRVVIDRAITVRSENGAATTTITGAFGTGADAPLGTDAVRGVRLSGGATLEGFTISGGSTIHFFPTPPQDGRGGGVFISGMGSVINCHITSCHSSREGAGIANNGAPGAVIRGTTIENNSTLFTLFGGNSGGGFHLANATVENCTVLGNSHASTGSRGGGGYLSGTSILTGTTFFGNNAANGAGVFLMGQSGMSDCTFINNTATGSGGGAYFDDNSSPVMPVSISGCVFNSNVAQSGNGGGIYAIDVKPTLAYTKVQGNQAGGNGGGIFIPESGNLDHCLVTGNSSGSLGGGAFMGWGDVSSSTFSGNKAGNNGGAIAASSAVSTVACLNTIIFANQANGDTTTRSASIHQDRNGFLSFQNCLVGNSGGSSAWGFGSNYLDLGANIDVDPVFLTPINPSAAPTNDGDFHLDPNNSPALDAGDRGSLPLGVLDLDESPRIRGVNIDLGVYENNITNLWIGVSGSDWASPPNWADGVPGDFEELYFSDLAASFQVDLDGPRTADAINIESDQAFTFNNPFLNIRRFLGAEGTTTHQINSRVSLHDDNKWRVGNGTILQANGLITDGGTNRSLTKSGNGRLELAGANDFGGGLNLEGGSVALLNDLAAGTGPITATLASPEQLQANFNNGPDFLTFSQDGFSLSYNDGDAHFNGPNELTRTFLRTVKGDFNNTDFVSEVTVTVVNGGVAYFGLGDGSRVSPTYEPTTSPQVFARLQPSDLGSGDLLISDDGVAIDPATSGEVGTGTHRVRMTYDRASNQLTFAIQQNDTGGTFSPTTTFDPIDCSDNAFTDSNSRIFFGGNKGVRFDDLTILSSEDVIVDIDYGNNVVIDNSVVLQRETINGQVSPKAIFPIEVSANQSVTQAGAISETSDPFTLRFHGGGNLTLGGQNTYTGGTLVEDGRLIVTGTTGSGPLEFRGGGTLMGTGSIAGSLKTDSRIGIQPGTMSTLTGTLTFESPLEASPLVYVYQFNGASHDQIVVKGNLNLSNSQLIIGRVQSGLNQPAYIIAKYETLSSQFASTLFVPSDYTIDYTFNDGTSTNNIALVRNTITSFDRWAIMSGLTFGINAGFTDDPNGDGITNLQHFAMATDPLGSGGTEGKQRVSIDSIEGSDHFTITLPVRAGAVFTNFPAPSATIDGVTYAIQGTNDLNSWDVELASVTPALADNLPALGDLDGDGNPDWEYHTFRFVEPATPNDNSFSRIKISPTP